jgi:hypothetical protein
MHENVCGNCVGGVGICMTFHKRAFDFFISLHINLIFKIARLWTVKEMPTLSYPHSSHINFCT